MGDYEDSKNEAVPAGKEAGGTEMTEQSKQAFARFAAAIDSIKGLDLTGIEPILPPTYKASRYRSS
ncbi:hypothetical protein [Cohnella rhizosphaerae]|uniref:Uncharacterized protein n=1 Tax=Cohnella rhizosphaerae TaxID=1457232 RepID=A0A9X4QTE7_9BACL|nr:hypothetical protein [Cohnella rhizosphaerae]MDG0811076.1 hypothetical protein [Cohnella rhizosphaerae]